MLPCRLFYLGYRAGVLQAYRLCPGGRDPHSPRHLVVFLYGGADEHLPPVVLFKNADSDATENFYAGSLCRADWWQLATVYLGGEQSPYAGSEPWLLY